MGEDIAKLYARINQLMGQCTVQSALIRALIGQLAVRSPDWREYIDAFKLMAEFNLKDTTWEGNPTDGTQIRDAALEYLTETMDDLYRAIAEQQEIKPPA